jgi:hypothetical protein
VEDGIIKIELVKSNDNDSDIFTKNVNQEMYERHVKFRREELNVSV